MLCLTLNKPSNIGIFSFFLLNTLDAPPCGMYQRLIRLPARTSCRGSRSFSLCSGWASVNCIALTPSPSRSGALITHQPLGKSCLPWMSSHILLLPRHDAQVVLSTSHTTSTGAALMHEEKKEMRELTSAPVLSQCKVCSAHSARKLLNYVKKNSKTF